MAKTVVAFSGLCLALLSAACQQPPAEPAMGMEVAPAAPDGLAYAQASCAGCHAVTANQVSPRSDAPPFPAIANREGLTSETLGLWLRGAHNYPTEMEFTLDEKQVEALVAYMLTLRQPGYKPLPD